MKRAAIVGLLALALTVAAVSVPRALALAGW